MLGSLPSVEGFRLLSPQAVTTLPLPGAVTERPGKQMPQRSPSLARHQDVPTALRYRRHGYQLVVIVILALHPLFGLHFLAAVTPK